MPTDKKISELGTDAAPTRSDFLTSLEGGTVNVKGAAGSYLALTNDSDINFTDNTTGDVSALAHGYAPKGSLPIPYLNYQDQQAQNTAGGTFTSGAWRTRVLNTEVADTGGYGSLASNQITLAAGTYLVSALAPARLCDRHQMRLQNVTAGTTLVVGQSAFESTGLGDITVAHLRGLITVAAAQALELQHQCQTTRATDGFGVAANFTTEVYAIVELWKIS